MTSKGQSIGELGTFYEKKLSQCRKKLKGRTFLDFSASIHPFCCKTPKKLKGGPFGGKKIAQKSHSAKKNLKGGPFGLVRYGMLRGKPFCFSSLGQQVQKIRKKFAQCQKKLKGGPFGLVRYGMLRGKPFCFSSLGQQVHSGFFSKFSRTFVRTILVISGGLKKH